MEKEFVPYELAVKLKDLGFEFESLGAYMDKELFLWQDNDTTQFIDFHVEAPLWQQALDWFREYYGFTYIIDDFNIKGDIGYDYQIRNLNDFEIGVRNKVIWNSFTHSTYHEARQACLEKLIELATKKEL